MFWWKNVMWSQFAHVLNVLTVGLSFRVHLEKCDSYSSSRECQGLKNMWRTIQQKHGFFGQSDSLLRSKARDGQHSSTWRSPCVWVSQLANFIFFALGEAACWDFLEEHWKEVLQHTANLEETFLFVFFVQFIAFKSCRFHKNVWNFRWIVLVGNHRKSTSSCAGALKGLSGRKAHSWEPSIRFALKFVESVAPVVIEVGSQARKPDDETPAA